MGVLSVCELERDPLEVRAEAATLRLDKFHFVVERRRSLRRPHGPLTRKRTEAVATDPRVEGHRLEIIGHIKRFVTIVLEAIDNDDGRLVRKLR